VLIQTEVGKVAHVARALSDLDGVQLAEDLAGPYDVIARVQASGLDQLGRLVVARIQVVDGVTRTLTCMCSIGSRVIRHRRPTLCLVELRGFEPLTPCMPSRDRPSSDAGHAVRAGHSPNWERPLWTADDRRCPLGHPPGILQGRRHDHMRAGANRVTAARTSPGRPPDA
jgi:Lrp/AsnC ligand binding domain